MAFTQVQLDALETAIAAGTLEVSVGDKKVRYHSLDEMIRLREIMRNQLDVASYLACRRTGHRAFFCHLRQEVRQATRLQTFTIDYHGFRYDVDLIWIK